MSEFFTVYLFVSLNYEPPVTVKTRLFTIFYTNNHGLRTPLVVSNFYSYLIVIRYIKSFDQKVDKTMSYALLNCGHDVLHEFLEYVIAADTGVH